MSQADLPSTIDPNAESGTALATHLTAWRNALHTYHSGSSRPSYFSASVTGFWLDTSAAPYVFKWWDGTQDIAVFKFDHSNHRFQRPVAEASIASAATTDVLGSTSDFIAVTGTNAITSLGTTPLQIKYVRFTGILTLTHNGSTLILPNNGNNITTGVGDTMIVISDASGNARVVAYTTAAGAPSATIPSGTKMLFQSTNAPSGWTKDTTHDDKVPRITTGTAASGGTVAFSTVFAQSATGGTSITQAHLPSVTLFGSTNSTGSHTHNYRDSSDNNAQASAGTARNVGVDSGADTGSDGSHSHSVTVDSGGSGTAHTHAMDIRVQYVDFIICTKN